MPYLPNGTFAESKEEFAARMHLVNGSTEVRHRSSDGCTVLTCGCAHTDTRWLQLCSAHYADWHALHNRPRDPDTIQGVTDGH